MSLAMVFPGQGSQSLGMQSALAAEFDVVRATWAEASEALGFDLWRIVANGPEEQLNRTDTTQPAMLTAGIAAYRAWCESGGDAPAVMAGHSLGEYSALVAANALRFSDALRVVRRRGELMQEAVPDDDSAMAAVLGLDDETILEICENASTIGVAEAVNFNSPGQVVVAGNRKAVDAVISLAKEAGAKRAIALSVSVPSHSSLLRGAGEALGAVLADTPVSTPETAVISSVAVRPYADADDVRELLERQVYSPVQWVRTVEAIAETGVERVVECGPGRVLAGLTRRIRRDLATQCIESPDDLGKTSG